MKVLKLITGFLLIQSLFIVGYAQNAVSKKLIPFQDKNKKWGYLDAVTKHIVIQPKYDRAWLFKDAGAFVANQNPQASSFDNYYLYGYINDAGKELFPMAFLNKGEVKTTKGELLQDLIHFTDKNGKAGIATKDGQWVFPIGMHYSFDFYDRNHVLCDQRFFYADGQQYTVPKGCIIESVDIPNETFYIRKDELHKGVSKWTGEILIPANYWEVRYYDAYKRYVAERSLLKLNDKMSLGQMIDMAEKAEDGKQDRIAGALFDANGVKLANYSSVYKLDVQDSIGLIMSQGKEKYISLIAGKEILLNKGIEAYWHAVTGKKIDEKGYVVFNEGERQGLSGSKREVIIPPVYASLEYINEKKIIARNSETNQYGVIDSKQNVLIPFRYGDIKIINDTLYSVSDQGKYGLINLQGKEIIPLKYYNELYFKDNRAEVYIQETGTHGIVGITGKKIIPEEYSTIFNTRELGETQDIYYRVEKNERWGLLDKNGKGIIPIMYGFISVDSADFEEGWVKVENDTRTANGAVNILSGKVVSPIYNFVEFDDKLVRVTLYDNQTNVYTYRLLGQDGNVISTDTYTSLEYQNGYYIAEKNHRYGLLNGAGKQVIHFNYTDMRFEGANFLFAKKDNNIELYVDVNGTEYLPE